MKYFIINEYSDYADEFSLEGFKLVKSESEEELKKELLSQFEFPVELSFGTNEFQEYETEKDLMGDLSISEITEEEYTIIEKVLGTNYGTTAIL